MDLALSSDQVSLIDSVSKLVAPYQKVPPNYREVLLQSDHLSTKLDESGFRDVASFDGMGPLDAVLLGEVIHALPYTVEFIGSALARALLGIECATPLALMLAPADAPGRFIVAGADALVIDGVDARLIRLTDALVEPVESAFAYPVGKMKAGCWRDGTRLDGVAQQARILWSIALATEIGASAKAAVELTLAYIKERRQFGKPLGSYQAIQHRISECVIAVQSAQILARRAAATLTPEAAFTALTYAKEICARIIYDTHQFQGAIGLTYEYPLHFYTYRLRLLHGELATVAECGQWLASARWDGAKIDWCE